MSIYHRPQAFYHDQAPLLHSVRLANPLPSFPSLLHPAKQLPLRLSVSTALYQSLEQPHRLTINVWPIFTNSTVLPSGPLSLLSMVKVQALICSRMPGVMEMAVQVELHTTPSPLQRRVFPPRVATCITGRRNQLRRRIGQMRPASQHCLELTLLQEARRRES